MLSPTEEAVERDWSWVWKLRVPQRIRTFLWLVLHGRLLTNEERARRRLCDSSQCELCNGGVEDLDHLFRHGPMAKEVWRELRLSGLVYLARDPNFKLWLQQNLGQSHEDPDWSLKFLVTLWYIWK